MASILGFTFGEDNSLLIENMMLTFCVRLYLMGTLIRTLSVVTKCSLLV